jgi:tetratricopeptide (TPR) repeat protein
MTGRRARGLFAQHGPALLPGAIVVGLMIVWAIHDGGYDADTWYWGALLALATLAVVLVFAAAGTARLPRAAVIAIACFGLYVAWSYLSITWAASPGDALQGSNRALLYLIVFTLMLVLPWTAEGALVALIVFTLAVGVIAIVILLRFASADQVSQLLLDGRLAAPTGYFNASVALFSLDAFMAIALAARRELPGLLRGTLIGIACAGFQLAVVGQSRGWLFTLPLVAVVSLAVVSDRLRVAVAAILPIAAAVIPVHRLLGVYDAPAGSAAQAHAATRAGRAGLILSAAALVIATIAAWAEALVRPRALSRRRRLLLGTALSVLAIAVGVAGAAAATHGDPVHFLVKQWNGFSHPPTAAGSGSHFATVGSGRYDFWRVALHAALAHPIGGLGQDNFADYYLLHRRTNEEPAWTHSLELRLLAHTGFVGAALFAAFAVAAIAAALRARRRSDRELTRAAAGVALLPLVGWMIYGSVDWFWEIPALSGPALGFLGVAIALGRTTVPGPAPGADIAPVRRRRTRVLAGAVLGAIALVAAAVVLGFPYLSVREVSTASDVAQRNPASALSDLTTAADLNPLSADPGRLGGTIALRNGLFNEAEDRFRQAIAREPGGWYAWLGAGLAASALGDSVQAQHYFESAYRIDRDQLAVREALARVNSTHPLTPAEAFKLLILVD